MAGNKNLHNAAKAKKDEFYTQLPDIENELRHYKPHFKGKVVLCNCDDPFESNFFKYFAMNFNSLGLKKLIATCYVTSPVVGRELPFYVDAGGQLSFIPLAETKPANQEKHPYKIVISEVTDENGDGRVDLADVEYLLKNKKNTLTLLEGDGDFRSPECMELLKSADIVCTNPPFSLFREYVAQLVDNSKDFLIIGNLNAVTYKEILPLVMNNKVWIGYNSGHYWFKVPDSYEEKKTDFKIDETGQKWRRMGNICWFTNLDIEKRHEDMPLFRQYNPEEFPTYDNYDAINVAKTADIPCDYYEAIGVPITYLTKFNPEQFELLGIDKDFTNDGGRFALAKPNGGGYTTFVRSSRYSPKEMMEILSRDYGVPQDVLIYRSGIMGVPITFMTKYNPAQFDILGKIDSGEITEYNLANPKINGKTIYKRIAIRRKQVYRNENQTA